MICNSMAEEEKKEESNKSTITGGIIAAILSIIQVFLNIISSRVTNTDLNKGEKNKKLQEQLDKNKKAIKDSHKTNNLDDIRKMLGK